MPQPKSLAAYTLQSSWGDIALTSANGIQITGLTHGQAIHHRAKFYAMRQRTRELEALMKGVAIGSSPYDELVCIIEPAGDTWTLSIVKSSKDQFTIKEI